MKPVPGGTYTVVQGDTIRNISRRAYGYDRSDRIVDANPFIVSRNKGISLEGLPFIYANDVLQIPATTSRYDGRKVTADFDTQLMVKLDGVEYKGVKASNIKRGMNTIADGFTFEIPFDYRDAKLVDRVRPYSYKQAVLYIGGEPYITGICMKPDFDESGSGNVCTMVVRTKPGNMIECMAPHKSLEYTNQTLLEIANRVAADYGVGRDELKAYSTHGDSNKFESAIKEPTETDFDFLKRLAAQKGFLITSAKDGNLMFVRATTDAKAVATLRAGQFPVKSCRSSFDGTKRFSEWRGYANLSGLMVSMNVQRDPGVPIFRPFAFTADESGANPTDATVNTKKGAAPGQGDAETQLLRALAGGGTTDMARAVRWRMCKSIADSASISVVVAGWHDPDGYLWEENTKVRFWGPGAAIFKEADFIMQSVELTKDTGGGDVANLALILPDAYGMTMPSTFPWSGYYADKGYKKSALESGERP